MVLGVGGYLLTSTTIRRDRDDAADRRARVEAVHTQEVLGRARAYVDGLAAVIAQEPEPGQARFARWAGATSASVGLNDVLWVERVPGSERTRYERLRGIPITRLTASGRVVRAPPARSYLPATYTSETRPELTPGVDVSTFPSLAAAIRDPARIFAVGASRPGSLGQEPGFYLLEAATFSRGPGRRGYLVAFVPRGWFSTTLGGDPRRFAISEGRQQIEGQLDSVQASAGFEMLGRHWRIDVSREPLSSMQSVLPWLALAWPFAVAGVAFLVGRAITRRRRLETDVAERAAELARSEAYLAEGQKLTRAGSVALEVPTWEMTHSSAEHSRLYGFDPAREVPSLDDFSERIHPEDRSIPTEAFQRGIREKTTVEAEYRVVLPETGERRLLTIAQPIFDGSGEVNQFMCTIIDVTERREAEAELERLAGEQAALRRVATLVAREATQAEVFTAIAEEIRQLFTDSLIYMFRYEDDRAVVAVASAGVAPATLPVGSRYELGGENAATRVFETGEPVRIDDYTTANGPIAEAVRTTNTRAVVATPLVIDGRLWGVMVVGSMREQLPPGTELRLGQFTELMATAVANTESRAKADRLASEQVALRRVATLVAEGAPPSAVLDAVAAEMEALLDADHVTVNRFEPGNEVVVLAHRGLDADPTPLGEPLLIEGDSATARVRRTGRPARMDDYESAEGALAEIARTLGLRSTVSAPITVEGGLWGLITASWTGERSPPADSEDRMVRFAALLDTAIANADSRDQLTASRARLLTAADDARRRVVRDLHDGGQQRLVHAIVTLKLAQRAFKEGNGDAESLVDEALEYAEFGNAELRELAHGILPGALTNGGLRAAFDTFVARLDLPVRVDVPDERLPAEIEASAYFIVAEALTNVVKHAQAGSAEVVASVRDGMLHLEIRDDGVGGADPNGDGLVGMDDRVTALGGRLRIESPAGGGTLVAATVPLR